MIAAANLAHRRVNQGRLTPEADRIGGATCQPPSVRSAAIDAGDDAVEPLSFHREKATALCTTTQALASRLSPALPA
jgi:hypothetical protein